MKKTKISKHFLQSLEKKYKKPENEKVYVGDIVEILYKIPEGDKERIQAYEGLILAKKNQNLGKSITIRRTVDGIGVEQVFSLNSPKIQNIKKKDSTKLRRSKLYYLRKFI